VWSFDSETAENGWTWVSGSFSGGNGNFLFSFLFYLRACVCCFVLIFKITFMCNLKVRIMELAMLVLQEYWELPMDSQRQMENYG
jgi:hypothetical protein